MRQATARRRPGSISFTDAQAVAMVLPARFDLFQNYANPFNSETEIRIALPQAGHVLLRIYNIIGNEVRTWWMINARRVIIVRIGREKISTTRDVIPKLRDLPMRRAQCRNGL
jgi:hypothetical protein